MSAFAYYRAGVVSGCRVNYLNKVFLVFRADIANVFDESLQLLFR